MGPCKGSSSSQTPAQGLSLHTSSTLASLAEPPAPMDAHCSEEAPSSMLQAFGKLSTTPEPQIPARKLLEVATLDGDDGQAAAISASESPTHTGRPTDRGSSASRCLAGSDA